MSTLAVADLDDAADKEMTLTEHLAELRRRLIISLAALGVGTVVSWAWSGRLLTWLAGPAGQLIFLAPTEAFFNRLKVAFFCGLIVSLPAILYQVWAFTACALGRDIRRHAALILPASYLLFLAGGAMAIFLVVPAALRFLTAYGTEAVRPSLALGQYVGFVTWLAVAFGTVFQIPLVLLFLNRAGVVSRAGLAGKRRYFYFAGFVAAALMTPGPDVFSQLALALPIVGLFEISLPLMR